MTVVLYLGLCALPMVAFALFSRGLAWFSTYEKRAPRPTEEDRQRELNRYRRDLRRLSAAHTQVFNSDRLPAKVSRLRAIELAYDDTLRRVCETLEVEDPGPSTSPALQRLQVEADLAMHGFTW